MRLSKVDSYLGICKSVSERSSCSRRKFGAIIVKDDTIISTGYNGSARGTYNCGIETEMPCLKDISGEGHYISYDTCPAIHAEQNAIIQSDPSRRIDGTMFLASSTDGGGDRPCHLCRRFIIQSKLKDIYYLNKENIVTHENINDWIKLENLWMEVIRDRKK